LDTDPAARISLTELAQVAGVNPEYLCRLLKASTGRSPIETVRLARLDRAALLLARSNYSVSEIATLCGYSSPFHFSQRFKAAFGQSPRDLRRSLEAGTTPPASRLVRTSEPIR
jgi:AraC-like DNA-binding protein